MSERIEARDYQKEALTTIYADLRTNCNVLLSAIMGSGKTFIAVRLIERLFNESNKKFLILTHKVELIDQFYQSFIQFTDIFYQHIGICSAGRNLKDLHQRIILGTIQTFINYMNDYDYCDLLVIDEAHRIKIGKNSQYDKCINYLRSKNKTMRILGLTATPFRLGHGYIYGDRHKTGNINLFDKINYSITYKELVDKNYLMKLEGFVCTDTELSNDLSTVKIQGGDYVLSQLGRVMSKGIHVNTVLSALTVYCMQSQKICVFACTIAHAEAIYQLIEKNLPGTVTIVHSKLSKNKREENLKAWRTGDKIIMISVNILVEGFDFKKLDTLIYARPTKSPVLWLQSIGRVLRILEGKDKALLIDLTLNTEEFGTNLDDIHISIPKNNEAEKNLDDISKLCLSCGEIVHIACRACPVCGYEWPVEKVQQTIVEKMPHMKNVIFNNNNNNNDDNKNNKKFWINIYAQEYKVHETKEGKKLGRIDFYSLLPYPYSLFLCFSDWYEGYAVHKAKEIWSKISDSEFPSDCESFEILSNSIKNVSKILVQKEGKYNRVVDFEFSNNNINDYTYDSYNDKMPF